MLSMVFTVSGLPQKLSKRKSREQEEIRISFLMMILIYFILLDGNEWVSESIHILAEIIAS